MKNFKSVLAMLLALVMILSCVGTAFAADKTDAKDLTGKTEITSISKDKKEAKSDALKGFKSDSFKELNSYQYADDEIVRAIVILEGKSEAEVGANGSEKAATQRAKLTNQHNAVRKAMAGIKYEMKYDFTRLLNGFSCDVAYGELEAIAAIDGVASVHIANYYEEPALIEADPQMDYANIMTGNNYMVNGYWDGRGIVVAVLDTGLNVNHEAFQDPMGYAAEGGVLTEEAVAAADTWVKGKYVSAKIPFAYDYAELDNDVTDYNGHGTHVSGIAVGLAATGTWDEGYDVKFCGASPAAQLLSMKIFKDAGGGTSSDIYFYALEDAYTLGVDVVNMSIGAQNGFTYDSELETEIFGNMYKLMEEAGVIMSVAAGNEYSMAENATNYNGYAGIIGPEYSDYGTVASPSTYEGNVSVASVENTNYPTTAIQVGETYLAYVDTAKTDADKWTTVFGGTTTEYVLITAADGKLSNGYAESYAGFDVTGKIAVVSRGDISFEEKVEFAANAGAAGCVVVNNQAGIIAMSIETFEIPAISLELSALEVLMSADPKAITTPNTLTVMENPNGYLMSDFSNWGTSPMLTIDPTITSVGGNVYSSVNTGNDAYEVYSGTSMAAPNATGTYANLLSAIYEYNEEITKPEAAELAKDLLYSTAEILYDADMYIYSVRKQGAGLANSIEAAYSYLVAAYITNPIQELGDDPEKTGVYEFSVEIKNDTEYSVYYTDFDAVAMYDYVYDTGEFSYNTMTADYANANVTYSANGSEISEFTLGAGESITVDVCITLSDAQKAYFDKTFPNGNFVEGYVVFTEYYEGKAWSQIHATYLAYYGNWNDGDILEQSDFRDIIEVEYLLGTTVADEEGNTYADLEYTWDMFNFFNYYTSPNIAYLVDAGITQAYAYAGNNMMDYVDYYDEHIAFSTPLTDGTWNYAETIYMEPYMLRNCEHMIMTVSDKETGEIYYVDDTEYLPKAVFDGDYAMWFAAGTFVWDGKDANGEYVPSGTVATITYDAVLPYGQKEVNDIWGFDVTVDYTAPTLDSIVFDEEDSTITVTATDENYLQAIYLANSNYDVLDYAAFSSDKKGESFTATFDVSAYIEAGLESVIVTAMDYATNEMEKETPFMAIGEPATITLVTPNGTEVIECVTGDRYTMGAGPEVENGQFVFWATEPVESATSEDIYNVGGDWYFEGDSFLVAESLTFYALYAVGSYVPYETPCYWYNQPSDYSGDWAICGWDYAAGGYDVTNPAAINGNGEKVYVADIEDAVIGDYYIEFYTASEDIRYTFTKVEGDNYTIQNVATGKYLALMDGAIAMADEASAAATWTVTTPDEGKGSLVYNVAEPSMILVYDDDEGEFAIMDDSQPIDWILANYGLEYYPSDYYILPLYQCDTEELVVEYYTTELCNHVNTEIKDAVEATCTEAGYTGDTYCADCGEKIADGTAIDALGHSYGDWVVTTAPTAANASEETRTCTACGATETREVPALGYGECYFDDFSDCKDPWYHEAVDFAVANELMNGVGKGKFAPEGTLTRGMVVTVLYRAAGCPEVSEASTFTDVAANAWYADAVAWAQDEGVVNGISATKFAPEENVTREQIAAILWRYAGEPDAEADMGSFKDANEISSYAKTAMAWAVSKGIFKGDNKASLNPTDSATRAEFACIIMRNLDGSYECK